MKLLFLLFLISACQVNHDKYYSHEYHGYEYHPTKMEPEQAKGSFQFVKKYLERRGHKKRRYVVELSDFTFKDFKTGRDQVCSRIPTRALKAVVKKENFPKEFEGSGIYLFDPMSGNKVGLLLKTINKQEILWISFSCRFLRFSEM